MAYKRRLGELLIDQRLITTEQLEHALGIQRDTHETLDVFPAGTGYQAFFT